MNSGPHPETTGNRSASIEFYQADSYEPTESVGFLMRHILTAVAHAVEQELTPYGLTHAQWAPMFVLGCRAQGPVTVAELARKCHLDAGAMTRLLDRLEAKGLCKRVRSQEDRRVVHIELTPEGQAIACHIPGALSRVQNAYLAGFDHDEWQTLKNLLRRMLANAHAITGTDAPVFTLDTEK